MTYFANQIALVLSKNGIITKEDEPVYVYGAEVVLNTFVSAACMLALGIISGYFFESLLFLFVYLGLRGRAGGYHASTFFRCYLCSMTIFFAFLCCAAFVLYRSPWFIALVLCSDLLLILTAPSQNHVNPKTKAELLQNKKIMCVMLVVSNLAIFGSLVTGIFEAMFFSGGCALIAVTILSVINTIQNYFRRLEK